MEKLIKSITIGIICIFTVFLVDLHAQGDGTDPITNSGKKWRIGYVEGGPYSNYQAILKSMIEDLMNSGWIEPAAIPECQDEVETLTLWNFLSTKIQSDYLEFPSDAYWSNKWSDTEREKFKKNIITRLNSSKDIDLMLAFGTWAGQDLANNQHNTSTMVLSSSNAVRSGIIKSVEDSGFDHIHAFIDPKRSERQIRLFHEITGFKRLGLTYEGNAEGRSYAAVDDVLKLSKELNFQVIDCILPTENTGVIQDEINLVHCYEQLAPKIDAIFMTDDGGLTKNNITKLLSPLFMNKVPMFAQTRFDLVKNGILMSACRADFKADAQFYTRTLAKILNGVKPGDLPQEFESPFEIVVNLETARTIGFRFPLDILAGADEIHETIQNNK